MVNMADAVNNARLIKVEISRAKSYLKRYELVKSLEVMLEVLDRKRDMQMIGADKTDIDLLLADYVADFNKCPLVFEFLRQMEYSKKQYITYTPGKDIELVNKLTAVKLKMAQIESQAKAQAARERQAKCEELLEQGREFAAAKEFPKARVCLKRAAEIFGKEPGILLRVGTILLENGCPKDAVDFLRKAVELFPADSTVYKPLVTAHTELGNLGDAVEVYKAALKQFGEHPQTLLNLAKLYLRMRKNYEAVDMAKRAWDKDNTLAEAKQIMDRY